MADSAGYTGEERPYPTESVWGALASPTEHKQKQLRNGNTKHRDLWHAEGVEVVWEEDAEGGYVPGSYHVRIQRNEYQDEEIFGKRYGIEGPVFFDY